MRKSTCYFCLRISLAGGNEPSLVFHPLIQHDRRGIRIIDPKQVRSPKLFTKITISRNLLQTSWDIAWSFLVSSWPCIHTLLAATNNTRNTNTNYSGCNYNIFVSRAPSHSPHFELRAKTDAIEWFVQLDNDSVKIGWKGLEWRPGNGLKVDTAQASLKDICYISLRMSKEIMILIVDLRGGVGNAHDSRWRMLPGQLYAINTLFPLLFLEMKSIGD